MGATDAVGRGVGGGVRVGVGWGGVRVEVGWGDGVRVGLGCGEGRSDCRAFSWKPSRLEQSQTCSVATSSGGFTPSSIRKRCWNVDFWPDGSPVQRPGTLRLKPRSSFRRNS